MNDTVRVTVDDDNIVISASNKEIRTPIEDLVSSCYKKTIAFQTDILAQEVGNLYMKIIEILDALPKQHKGYSMTTVSFSIVLDSEGKASLFSAISASSRAQAGLTFVIKREGESNDNLRNP